MVSGILGLLLWVASEGQAAVPSIAATGQLPRGVDPKSLTLELSLEKVDPLELGGDDEKKMLQKRVKLYLSNYKDDSRLKYQGETTTEATAAGYELSFRTDPKKEKVEDADRYNIKYTLTLTAVDGFGTGILKEVVKDQTSVRVVNLKLKYQSANNETKDLEFTAVQKVGVPNAAPSDFSVAPQHRGLAFNWATPGVVSYNDNSTAAPSGTSVFVINLAKHEEIPDLAARRLPAVGYQTNKSAEKPASCALTYDLSAQTCGVDCEGQVAYLVSSGSDLAAREDLKVVNVSGTASAAALTELEPGQAYAVLGAFEPEGVARTACYIASPKINKTLTELNGAKEAEPGNPNCFVATAAYGSPLADELHVLRHFRNGVLLKSAFGKQLVRWYYRYSPRLARIIARHDGLRMVVRGLLYVPVKMLDAQARGKPWPFYAALGGPACLFVGIFAVVGRRRRWS